MLNYELVAKPEKGSPVIFQLEVGSSKKGRYATVFGVAGNKALPFGKLYVDETELAKLATVKKDKS